MKILQVNKFFYENGGSERYFFDVTESLRAAGHEVVYFSMQDKRNHQSPWSKYFAPAIDFNSDISLGKAAKFIYSRAAVRQLKKLIVDTKPDVAHLHNIAHQLTPAIISTLKKAGLPVVMTLHDYQVLCPNYQMYTQQKACERCKRHSYWNAIRYRCVRNSVLASALSAVEMVTHNLLLKNYQKVDRYIAPSKFMKERMEAWGWSVEKLTYLPHFVNFRKNGEVIKKAQVLFVGRLVREKGAHLLLEVAGKFPKVNFIFAGDGEERERLQFEIERRSLENCRLLGSVSAKRVRELMQESQVLAVPSLWYENAPLVVYEALTLGTAVVASAHGGLPELISPGKTGELFTPGDTAGLAKSIKKVLNMRSFAGLDDPFPAAKHIAELVSIYEKVQTK